MYQGMTHVPHARRRVEKIMNPNSLQCTIHLSITKTNERYKGCFGEDSSASHLCITVLSIHQIHSVARLSWRPLKTSYNSYNVKQKRNPHLQIHMAI